MRKQHASAAPAARRFTVDCSWPEHKKSLEGATVTSTDWMLGVLLEITNTMSVGTPTSPWGGTCSESVMRAASTCAAPAGGGRRGARARARDREGPEH
jgi:hypothetical protein